MIVTLSNEFRVDVDKWNHKLEVYTAGINPKTREEVWGWTLLGFFPNMIQCINKAAHYKVMSNNERIRFDQYVEQLQKTLDDFTQRAKEELQ